MPRRSRASSSRPLSRSTRAKANIPMNRSTQRSPHGRVRLRDHLGVARREEAVALALQLGAQLPVVVDAAVEHDGAPDVRIHERLGALLGQIDDLQPAVGEGDRPGRPGARAVGPAGRHRGGHRLHGGDVGALTGPVLSGESAHPRQLPAIAPSVAYPWRHDGADQEATAKQAPRQRRGHHRGARAHRPQAHGRASASPPPRRPGRSAGSSRRPGAARSTRAAFATVLFAVLVVLLMGRTIAQAAVIAAFMLVLYIPLGYYMDMRDLPSPQAPQRRARVARARRPHAHGRAAAGELLPRPRRRGRDAAPSWSTRARRPSASSRRVEERRRHARGDPAHPLPLRPHRRGRAGRARDGRAGLVPGARDRPAHRPHGLHAVSGVRPVRVLRPRAHRRGRRDAGARRPRDRRAVHARATAPAT